MCFSYLRLKLRLGMCDRWEETVMVVVGKGDG